jgi:nucleoside-diphosphate-sugar epimerase
VTPRTVFVTGGTGYLGRELISALVERGHHVIALVRPQSVTKLPENCRSLMGDPLLSPGHCWPYVIHAPVFAVEHPPEQGAKIVEVPKIRASIGPSAQ